MESIFESSGPRKEILLQMIKTGSCTARELSSVTRIPKNKVYSFLKDLVQLSLVNVFHGPSKKAEATYAIRKEEMLSQLAIWKKTLSRELADCKSLEKQVESEIYAQLLEPDISTGKEADAESKTIEILRRAKRSICISTYTFSWFDRVLKILLERLKAGVSVKILLLDPSSKEFFSYEHKNSTKRISNICLQMGAEVYHCKSRLPFRGTIVDESVMLMMAFPFLNEQDKNMSTGFVLCSNQALVSSIANYFGFVCEHGVKYSQE